MSIHLLRALQDPRAVCGAYLPEQGTTNATLVTCSHCRTGILPIPEDSVLRYVRQLAKQAGFLCYHTHDARRSASGYPDCTVVDPRPGRGDVYMWELKTRTGKASIDQQCWLAALHGKTIRSRVIRPGDLEEITALLLARGRR